VYNASTTTINAENNWWELASGPCHATLNPTGAGDAVSDYVDFCPWLLEPYSASNAETTVTSDNFGTKSETFTGTDTTVDTGSAGGGSNADITVKSYDYSVPEDAGHALCIEAENQRALKYIDIRITSNDYTSGYIYVTMTYTDAELAAAGISDESTLSLYYYSSGTWVTATDVTRDTDANWVKGAIPYNAFSGTPLCLGGVEDTTGHYTVGAEPDVTVVFTPSYMDPQVEQTVTVHVDVSAGTLADLSNITFKLWYDTDSSTFSESEFDSASANTQECAIITWDGSFHLSSGSPTTWSLGSCTAATSGTSGDFVLKFTPGKVAKATTTGNIWQLAATVTSTYGTGFDYDAGGADMNWYGQIVLSAATIDWGVVPPGLLFTDDAADQSIGSTITIISNGAYDLKAKSGATWSGTNYTAILDAEGTCIGYQYFSLKANDDGTYADSVLLRASGLSIATGGLTDEDGYDYTGTTLWLKLSESFYSDVYTGTITFVVSAS
jgi:hypothetical protein